MLPSEGFTEGHGEEGREDNINDHESSNEGGGDHQTSERRVWPSTRNPRAALRRVVTEGESEL